MPKVRVAAFSISLDGFGAGPHQDIDNPLGGRGLELHSWFQNTAIFRKIHNQTGGTEGLDNDFAAQSFENIGAWVIGRNMFGPIRGPWPDHSWKGWWGDEPPYHTPVFVLTHHTRPSLLMKGGTTFHFITDGLDSAIKQARAAANGKDVRIGGGVSVLRACLSAGFIDQMHLALSPVLLGEGENLFADINLHQLGFVPVKTVQGEMATHFLIDKRR